MVVRIVCTSTCDVVGCDLSRWFLCCVGIIRVRVIIIVYDSFCLVACSRAWVSFSLGLVKVLPCECGRKTRSPMFLVVGNVLIELFAVRSAFFNTTTTTTNHHHQRQLLLTDKATASFLHSLFQTFTNSFFFFSLSHNITSFAPWSRLFIL